MTEKGPNQNPEGQERKKLEGLQVENLDIDNSFEIKEEVDENGQPIDGEVYWLSLESEKDALEGKYYLPSNAETESKGLIIFEPGLPGDSVVLFDERHAPNLIKEGYSVFVARHNGTIIKGEKAPNYIHCPQKQGMAEKKDQEFIGQPFSFSRWSREPLTAIRALQSQHEKIHLMGHSMGALNCLHTLIDLEKDNSEICQKIKTLTTLSGQVGNLGEDGRIDPEGINSLNRITGFLDYIKKNNIHQAVTPEKNIEELIEVIRTVHDPKNKYPHQLRAMSIMTAQDEYVSPEGIGDLERALRKTKSTNSIKSLTAEVYLGRRNKKNGNQHEFHDLSDLPTGRLIAGIENQDTKNIEYD